MAKIFISYSIQDKGIIDNLWQQLISLGHQPMYVQASIIAGQNWKESINQAVKEADGFIFLITENSLHSPNIMMEFGEAQATASNEGKFIIPIVAQKVNIPNTLKMIQYLELDDSQLIGKIQDVIEQYQKRKGENQPRKQTMPASVLPKRIKVTSKRKKDQSNEQKTDEPGYWFLKLNPNTWKLSDLENYLAKNDEALFGTHNLENERRVDYHLFFQVKKGDKAIGYAFGDKRAVMCIFEINSGVDIRKEVGEVISLSIQKVLHPAIPIEYIADQLPFRDKLEAEDPERIFSITTELFDMIINSDRVDYINHESYLTNYTTEGDHRSTEDQLSFSADIASFGTVICLKKVKPPLAIGLFGKWGSGKSFFMEKLVDHIEELTATEDTRYVRHIVQVRFNSWHYSDANLWASLITEIFDSLNSFAQQIGKTSEIEKLSATLQVTSLHKEEAEQRRIDLRDKVNLLKAKQKEKRARLEDLSGLKFLKTLFSDPNVRKDIDSLNNGGIEAIKEHQNNVENYIRELDSFQGKIKLFFKQLVALRGVRWLWLIVSAILIFLTAYLIHTNFSLQWSYITVWFSVKIGLLATGLGKVVEAIRSQGRLFKQVSERWSSLKKTFEDRPQEYDVVLNAHEQELLEVTTSLKEIDWKLEQTRKEIVDINSGKKLLEFIDQKSRDEGYAKQLGLIASIRKDFQTLDYLLREQHAPHDKKIIINNPENVQLEIDRIVLYIDDLDRCNEDIVVRVLEAIHLLLAFPLFVVVVGVDPRWLNNALNKKYSELFNTSATSARQQNITSYDYLEKIFQIPFTLKDADKNDRKRLLKYLMREELVNDDIPVQPIFEPPTTEPATPSSRSAVSAHEPNSVVSAEESAQVLSKVDFREEELSYMEGISGMFGQTPRMLNRYVNIYRIIKSHKNYQVGRIASARDYKSTMFVLAIIIGCPAHARVFVELLNSTTNERMIDFVEQLTHAELRQFITVHTDKNDVNDLSTTIVKKNLTLISRFSFRTYEADAISNPVLN